MIRAAGSTILRRTAQRLASSVERKTLSSSWKGGTVPPTAMVATMQISPFHASSRREADAAAVTDDEVKPTEEEKPKQEEGGLKYWDPVYAIPIGIMAAVPIINYEWYIINEETQLAGVFILLNLIVYKSYGNTLYDYFSEDGKQLLAAYNAKEDAVINTLQNELDECTMYVGRSKDEEDIKELKIATYDKLVKAGQMKPQHEMKAQIEKALSTIAVEEAAMKDKMKMTLMEEAKKAVSAEFATNKKLIQSSLDSALVQLKGSGGGGKASADPVKDAYLKFFKEKSAAAANMDPTQEAMAARESIITKLNTVAMNDGFFFRFGPDGKPVMVE